MELPSQTPTKLDGGVKHDANKPDFSMVSYELLEQVSFVRMFGARKYTMYGECTCSALIVTEIEKFGLKNFANLATTPAMLKTDLVAAQITKESIDKKIKTDLTNLSGNIVLEILGTQVNENFKVLSEPIMSTTSNLLNSLHRLLVLYAVGKINYVSTTVTSQEGLEKDFVRDATLLLESWKKESGLKKHKSTCPALNEVRSGRNNWRKGFAVTRSCAAALRHIYSFLRGETNDSESGLPHLAHAVCCLEHAIFDMVHHPNNDDRST